MAELVVRYEETPGGLAASYKYEFRSSKVEGTGPLEQEYMVEPAPALIRNLCGKIDKQIIDALKSPAGNADPATELAQTSQLLYTTLFPEAAGYIPELAQRLRRADDSLLVRTNESLIPWELLHDGEEFLGLAHDVSRRTFVTGRVVGGRTISKIERALIVGDPLGDLESAHKEASEVATWLSAHGVKTTLLLGAEATLLRIIEELAGGAYDLLHYCGHVTAPAETEYVGLWLHDDELLDGRALAPLSRSGAPPIVFLNGCSSAARLANLCVEFMMKGAQAVVGTRYPIGEESARQFAEAFYTNLISGEPAGAAVRSARLSLRQSPTIDWASFVLYGDPAMRITTDSPTTEIDERIETPQLTFGYQMDEAAGELMDRIGRQAAPRGIVISWDLLLELLSTEDIRGRATSAADAARLTLIEELLQSMLETAPMTPADADATVAPADTVALSDTVRGVLDKAERRAQESGRESITTSDLIAAFVAIGGGSSSHILELFNISLADLAGLGSTTTDPPPTKQEPEEPQPSSLPKDPLDAHGEKLFDTSGRLRTGSLNPTVATALRVAGLLASSQGTVISTGMILYGLAVASSAPLREFLLSQGDAGLVAYDRLTLPAATQQHGFSPRTRRALQRAANSTPNGDIDDATILREILSEPTSSARKLLARLNIEPAGPDR